MGPKQTIAIERLAPHVSQLRARVWIAVRENLREVVECVSIADLARENLPESINELSSDPDAWVTRRTGEVLS